MKLTPNHVIQVAIVGGGISGLTAAWELSKNPAIQWRLFEANDRVGGILETIYDSGYLIERAADNFATLIPDAYEFCEALGYESELIRPNPHGRRAFVLNRGRILPIPLGFSLMQPTRLDSMLLTRTLSWAGKWRVAQEYWTAAKQSAGEDESLESFVTRRLGREAFENLVEPIVSGIFTADPSTLSMAATMPQFLEMERRHGGLIRGYLKSRKSNAKAVSQRASGARYDQFCAPAQGMSHWLKHIVRSLPPDRIQLNSPVTSLARVDASTAQTTGSSETNSVWKVRTRTGEYNCDAVIISAPAAVSAGLLHDCAPVTSRLVGSIRYASSAVAVLVVKRSEILRRMDGFGLIVPRKEHKKTLAISYSSNKYAGRVPDDQVLLRIFLGGALAPDLVDQSDQHLFDLAESELKAILGWSGHAPLWRAIVRWKHAMPQYLVGHLDLVSQIDQSLKSLPGLMLCGAAFRGVGIPQCVRDGKRAARELSKMFTPQLNSFSKTP